MCFPLSPAYLSQFNNSQKVFLLKITPKYTAGVQDNIQITCPCFFPDTEVILVLFLLTSLCDVSVPKILNHLKAVWLSNSVGIKAHINKERDFQTMFYKHFFSSGN